MQTLGRSFFPKRRHRLLLSRFMHLVPAGLPFSIPGIDEDIEITIQQAPQPGLHLKLSTMLVYSINMDKILYKLKIKRLTIIVI